MSNFSGSIRNATLAFALIAATGVSAETTPKLTLGVFPGVEPGQSESFEVMDRFLPLAHYLSSKIGTQVLLLPVRVPELAMKSMVQGDASYKLFFGPMVFVSEAVKKAGFVPIVVEEERIRGVFVVKQDSKLQSLKDLGPATRIAMPSPNLLLSNLADDTLAQQHIVLQAGARMHMATVEGMVLAVDTGTADVAVIRDRSAQKIVSEQPSRFRIVGQTVDAPGFALIAHKQVAEDMRAKLRRAALALNKDSSALAVEARTALKTSPFVAGRDDEFLALQRMMDTSALASGK